MSRPNFLIFITDQQNGAVVLPGSSRRAETPYLDRIREQGVTFSQAYCPSPHCCPSRATWLTGLYPSEHGVRNNVENSAAQSRGFRPGVRLWSEDLALAGYDMEYSGKWHVSVRESPAERGWKTRYVDHAPGGEWDFSDEEFTRKAWDSFRELPPDPSPRGEGEILRPGFKRYCHYGEGTFAKDEAIIEDALEVIRNRGTQNPQPWCQVVAINTPHDPYVAPQEFLDRYPVESIRLPANFDDVMDDKPGFYRRTRDVFSQLSREEHIQAVRHYLAACSYADSLFGKVLEAIEATGQMNDTVVMFLSDHGDYVGEHGLWCKGLPCFRPAYHIPFVIKDPRFSKSAGSTVEQFVSLADFAPTLLDLTGIEADRKFTGGSLLPFLEGTDNPAGWRQEIITQTRGNSLYGMQRSIMTDKWKFTLNGFDYDELYDLENDPGEMVNLARKSEYNSVIRDLCRRLWAFLESVQDECLHHYIMVGFAPYGPGVLFEESTSGN